VTETQPTTTIEDTAHLTRASVTDTLGVLAGVMAPILARGVIIRRPRVVALAERLDLDRRAVRRMQRLHDEYGPGPLLLRVPLREQAVLLEPGHVHRVLDGSPEPFATASDEKRAALAHFQPKGVLISHGVERADRRRFNEVVLDVDEPVHRLGARFASVVREEAGELVQGIPPGAVLSWDRFADAWFRVVRRVVLGDSARDDEEFTALTDELRAAGNWAFLRPKRRHRRAEFLARIGTYVERAEPGSLAGAMAQAPVTARTAPEHQVPQWLFAFDPAGMATFRALALLAAHPEPAARARDEARSARPGDVAPFWFLRAAVLEALRLWPTTPAVLRQTTRETRWNGDVLAPGAGVFIFANYFHRDDRHLPYADRFQPELWLEDRSARDWPLIPFSGGPAMCPGRNVVLLTASTMLASLLAEREVRLDPPDRLDAGRPLPGTLDNYSLRFLLG
jgi:cytochrome P450